MEAGVRRVLVTRPPDRWPRLRERFSTGPILVEMRPTAVPGEPDDPGPGERAIAALSRYAWLIVASAAGAEALVCLLARADRPRPAALRVAAVGPATARALASAGLAVDLVASDPRGEGLARQVAARLSAGERALLVVPEGGGVAGPALRAAGVAFDEAPLYRTVASPEAAQLAHEAIAGRFAGVGFTAPSSLDLWLRAAGGSAESLVDALSRLVRIAIGPTTAARLEARGLAAHAVAAAPDETSFGDAIERAFAAG